MAARFADANEAASILDDATITDAIKPVRLQQIDEAYSSLAKMTTPLLNLPYGDNPEIFFRPIAAKFCADPRFKPLAANLESGARTPDPSKPLLRLECHSK